MIRSIPLASCSKRRAVGIFTRAAARVVAQKTYATVSPSIVGQTPHPAEPTREEFSESVPPILDRLVLQAASKCHKTLLPDIIKQYIDTAGTVLDLSLPYESRPSDSRRPSLTNSADSCKNVITVAHCAQVGSEHKITLSSGFALNIEDRSNSKGETLILTCAHTLEEASPLSGEGTILRNSYLKLWCGADTTIAFVIVRYALGRLEEIHRELRTDNRKWTANLPCLSIGFCTSPFRFDPSVMFNSAW